MKIFEIGTGYTPIPAKISAATEIVVEELTKAFLKMDVPVEIIDISADDRRSNDLPIRQVYVPKLFTAADVHLGIMHKLKRVVYSLALARELRKILKEANEKVIFHFHNQYNLFFFLKLTPSSLRGKCTIAYTNHSGIWCMEWTDIEETIRRRYFQEAFCMKHADVVFLLNEKTKKNVMEHLNVPEQRIRIVANGVNTDVYRPLPEAEKDMAKQRWGLAGRTVILQVGSINENKGQLRSVQYLLPLMKKDPALTFVYAGGIVDEGYRQKLQDFAEENGIGDQVRYLGMLPPGRQMNAVYNMAAATLFPSTYESFGMVVIESLAAGVPVMLDKNGPVHFEEGTVVYSTEDFSETLENRVFTVDRAYSDLCAAARKNAVENFAWKKVAKDHIAVFKDIR